MQIIQGQSAQAVAPLLQAMQATGYQHRSKVRQQNGADCLVPVTCRHYHKAEQGQEMERASMSTPAAVHLCSAVATCWWLSAAHLDVAPDLSNKHAPEHAGVLHFKALEGDGDVLKAGHVQGPGQGALLLGPPWARCQVAAEAAGEGEVGLS